MVLMAIQSSSISCSWSIWTIQGPVTETGLDFGCFSLKGFSPNLSCFKLRFSQSKLSISAFLRASVNCLSSFSKLDLIVSYNISLLFWNDKMLYFDY